MVSPETNESVVTIVNNLQNKDEYNVGIEASNVPTALKDILPISKFLLTKQQNGVYVVFFPHNKTVYIGESTNISRELSMLRGGYRNQAAVNEAFSQSGKYVSAFAVLQGPGLKEKETRKNLEKMLIRLAGSSAINIINNVNPKTNPYLADPAVKRAVFIPYNKSWTDYDLKYPNLSVTKNENCIYLLLHKDSGHFYIGESAHFIKNKVLRRHRSSIASTQALALQGQKVKCAEALNRIITDILSDGTEFWYSAIEYTTGLTEAERKKKEEYYREEGYHLYKDRLYNPPGKTRAPNIVKRSEQSKDLNRVAALAQRKISQFSSQKSYPCIINGVWYESMAAAGRALGQTVKGSIKKRLLSSNFPNYIWLKDTQNKAIPYSPELEEKLKKYAK